MELYGTIGRVVIGGMLILSLGACSGEGVTLVTDGQGADVAADAGQDGSTPGDVAPREDTTAPEDTTPPADTVLPEDTVPPEDTILPEDTIEDLAADAPGEVSADVEADVPPIPCDPAPVLSPFMLGGQFPLVEDTADLVVSSTALVTAHMPWCCDAAWEWETSFELTPSGETVTLLYALPGQAAIPVEVGDTVYLHVEQQQPWWQNRYIALWDAEGAVRFALASHDDAFTPGTCGGYSCPLITLDPSDCEAVDGTCGTVTYPPIRFAGAWGGEEVTVHQGESLVVETPGTQGRFSGVQGRRNITMDCDDYPDAWLDALFVDSSVVSQCYCEASADCAADEVCETEAHRCVPNACLGTTCGEGEWCDPYTGQCSLPPPSPLPTCESTADCGVGPSCEMVCNTELGICQESICCLVDCMGSCSGLLDTCYQCLSDCDCTGGQVCSPSSLTCGDPCVEEEIGFTQENTPMYEFYELCVAADAGEQEAALQAIDDSLYCGVGGVFADCKSGETACHGDLDYADWQTKEISDAKWAELCALSQLDVVTKIAGGHWL